MALEPEEEELLEAIYRDPTSDGPRHVYADFLLARGDLRGALINVQCLREKASGVEHGALLAEERRLYRWYGPHPLLAGGHCREVRRGFLAAVTVDDVSAFVEGKVLARYPTIEELALGSVERVALQRLLSVPAFSRIRILRIRPVPGIARLLVRAPLVQLHLQQLTQQCAGELVLALPGSALADLGVLRLEGALGGPWVSSLVRSFPSLHTLVLPNPQRYPFEPDPGAYGRVLSELKGSFAGVLRLE